MARPTPVIPDERRRTHRDWLVALTQIPTATAREHRVIDWIERWVAARGDLRLVRDRVGNLQIAANDADLDEPALYITAHLDHPAFVVERVTSDETVVLVLRGGVMDDYLLRGRVVVHTSDDQRLPAALIERTGSQTPDKRFLARLDEPTDRIAAGDIATWDLPGSEIVPSTDDGGIDLLHAPACDDLAGVAAALAAMDELRACHTKQRSTPDVRLLLTLAEEVGFVGAIGACRAKTMPAGSRVLALETSRALPEVPIGSGPIVRVGDRLSIFSPSLVAAVCARAEALAGGPPPTASQKLSDAPAWKWQRRLMAGGACETTAYCAFGYESICLCVALGNYHNMGDLDAVQADTNTSPPRAAREFIAVDDFEGLVDLLVACGIELPEAGAVLPRLAKIWTDRKGLLSGAS